MLNLIQDRDKKAPFPANFGPVTSANIGSISQNLVLIHCYTGVKFKGHITSCQFQIIKLERRALLKKLVFLVISLENWGYDHIYNIIWFFDNLNII